MQTTLKMVSGAVSTQDLIPVLTHFCIYDGRIQGGNGRLAIDAPCPELIGMDAVIPADRFLKAVNACAGDPKMALNDDKTKLSISKGKFRARVALLPSDSYPREAEPAALHVTSSVTPSTPLMPILKRLAPFVSTDASRPWACSILLRDGYAYATNNVIIARIAYDWPFAELMIPSAAVNEIIRIGEEPSEITVTAHGAWVFYDNGCWMKVQLLDGRWPEQLSALMAKLDHTTSVPLPEGLLDDVELLKPFFPDPKVPIVRMSAEGVSTQDGLHSATVEAGTLPTAAFRYESLSIVLSCATHANFAVQPSPWRGDGIEGLLAGVRM